ncbi:unnamed protein product [Cunninghamella echinulata]
MAVSTEEHQGSRAEYEIMIDPVTGKTVPMKDGKPCRVCNDFKTWSRIEKQKGKAESATKADSTTTKGTETKTATQQETQQTSDIKEKEKEAVTDEWRRKNCPPDVEVLGNATWTLLHTTAAYYPDRPTPSQKESMKTFIESFAQHYPCWFCKVNNNRNNNKTIRVD